MRLRLLAAALFVGFAGLLLLLRPLSPALGSREGRCAYLAARGWTVDPESEDCRLIELPKEFDAVLENYNAMQREAGFDLSRAAGGTCRRYTYELSDYPGFDGRVLAVLYVWRGRVIAGDIHTARVDGFMRPL